MNDNDDLPSRKEKKGKYDPDPYHWNRDLALPVFEGDLDWGDGRLRGWLDDHVDEWLGRQGDELLELRTKLAKEFFLRAVAEFFTVKHSAIATGIPVEMVQRWRREDKAFDKALGEMRQLAIDEVEYGAYKSGANDGGVNATTMLKAHRPGTYGPTGGDNETVIRVIIEQEPLPVPKLTLAPPPAPPKPIQYIEGDLNQPFKGGLDDDDNDT